VNSQLAFWFAKQKFATKQGGFYDFEPRYSSQTPIPPCSHEELSILCQLVNCLLWLHRHPQVTSNQKASPRDPLMLSYFEQIINGLVYELFFEDELHAAKLHPFNLVEQARLPDLDGIAAKRRLDVFRETFERVYDTNHPLRGCLYDLGSLETVRIIEGRE
jgi:hypothetical protein